MKLYLFTESFPYGQSEAFLENEFNFLSKSFDKVIILPLYAEEGKRILSGNTDIKHPLLSFNLKQRKKLLINGIFNISPFIGIKEFFQRKVYLKKEWVWNYFTSLLIFRTLYSKNSVWQKLIKTIEPHDIIYFYWGDKTTLILPYLKRKIKNKTVVRFHRTDLYEYAKKGYIPFRGIVFPSIDHFLPISYNGKNYLLQNYPQIISPDKIKVCRLGVFDHGLNPVNNDSSQLHIVSCSYMVPVKRIHLIIEALRFLHLDIIWTHIGTGILDKKLKTLAKSLPANIKVEFKGAMKNSEVLDYYKNTPIDLFINVSESEGVPVSIMEALSFGIPVIASDVGGTAEIVDNAVGKLLDINTSAEKIAEEIMSFANSDTTASRKHARLRWAERSDAEKNYREFVDFLKE